MRVCMWIGERTFRAEELAGDVEGLAAHDNNLLTVQKLLRDRAGKTAEQVALAVDDLCHCQSMLLSRQ